MSVQQPSFTKYCSSYIAVNPNTQYNLLRNVGILSPQNQLSIIVAPIMIANIQGQYIQTLITSESTIHVARWVYPITTPEIDFPIDMKHYVKNLNGWSYLYLTQIPPEPVIISPNFRCIAHKYEHIKEQFKHCRVWYDAGFLYSDKYFKNRKRIGHWRLWRRNGELLETIDYDDDKQHGCYKIWYDNHRLAKEACYVNGVEDSYRCWDEDGNPLVENFDVSVRPILV